MENNKPENPFAFPWVSSSDSGHVGQAGYNEGMTLRDYLAAKAMTQVMMCYRDYKGRPFDFENRSGDAENIAIDSYLLADAMLKERSK